MRNSPKETMMRNAAPLAAATGATGFTGGALVRKLLAEGYCVRALARDPGRMGTVHLHLVTIAGDLGDRGALAKLVCGADVVFHIAAMFRHEGTREQFVEANYRGTVNMLQAARAAGVRRFVHCSTIGVHGDIDCAAADESSPFNACDVYQETKAMAEEACVEESARAGMEMVIVRPCSIYGPGDLRMLKMFRMLERGYFIMIGDGRPNFHPVYIDDLVDGFMAAARLAQAAGETFIVGGPRFLPLAEYLRIAAATVGARPPRGRIPYGVMEAAAWACETVCVPFGIEPPLHRRRLSFFKNNRAFCIEKARRVLGYEPRVDVEQGFRLTVDWYRRMGLLRAPEGAAPERAARRTGEPYASSGRSH